MWVVDAEIGLVALERLCSISLAVALVTGVATVRAGTEAEAAFAFPKNRRLLSAVVDVVAEVEADSGGAGVPDLEVGSSTGESGCWRSSGLGVCGGSGGLTLLWPDLLLLLVLLDRTLLGRATVEPLLRFPPGLVSARMTSYPLSKVESNSPPPSDTDTTPRL